MLGPVSIDTYKYLAQFFLFNAEENTFTLVTIFGFFN